MVTQDLERPAPTAHLATNTQSLNDIEVRNTAAMMRQDNKNVEHLKGEGGDGEEVDRNHAAEAIAKENLPVLGGGPSDLPIRRAQASFRLPKRALVTPASGVVG